MTRTPVSDNHHHVRSPTSAGALGQRMPEEYLRSGSLYGHLPKARALHRDRAAALDAALREPFADLGEPISPNTTFTTETADVEHLRLSFSRIEVPEIEQGIAGLAGR